MDHKLLSILSVVSISVSVLAGATAQACLPETGRGIFPENNLNIPEGQFSTNGITENKFLELIASSQALYAPTFVAQGRTLEIVNKWSDGTVNAYAKRAGNTSQVFMFGGLARHPKVTMDAFQLVICHELGHHIGGAPKTSGFFGRNSWASDEGESDYFATLKCAREVWKNDDNAAIVAKMEVPAKAVAECQKAFNSTAEISLCERSAMAGKSLADTLADMGKGPATDFETLDPAIVSKTNHAHPKAQCRLDTYLAGAVCAKPKDVALSDLDTSVGACASEKGEVLGVRPVCWYKPAEPGDKPSKPGSSWPSVRLGFAR